MQKQIRFSQLFINNEFVDSEEGLTLDAFNPATEEKIATLQRAGPKDIEKAIKCARDAFDKGEWSKISYHQRGELINKFADLIQQNQEELAWLECINNGKTHAAAQFDIQLTVECLKYYAGFADKIHGKTYPVTGEYICYTSMEPVGVCAHIIPWNFPILMAAWKWGPCLATGCVSILKSSEKTPLSILCVADLARKAGIPAGVIQILTGGGEVGSYLSSHKQIDKVAFTGSTAVGKKILQASSQSNLKRTTLELGGKSANIVCEDCDLETAIDSAIAATYCNLGQSCNAGSRTFVHEKMYDAFCKRVVERVSALKVGDPFSKESEYGCIIDKLQFDRVLNYIEIGKKEGAKLLLGGKRIGTKGYFIELTIFADVTDQMTIAKEEIFGPVMSILKYSNYQEVVDRANDTDYGLAAGVQTKDIELGNAIARKLKAGHVYINCYDYFDANTPFGGFKQSGIGRELGKEGLKAYLELKTNIVKIKHNL